MVSKFHNTNTSQEDTDRALESLSAAPKTDIYAAPSHGYVFSAPMSCLKLQSRDFKRASVIVNFNYAYTYDQGGLILYFPSPNEPNPDSTNSSTRETAPKWIKAGIEVHQGVPQISVVAREEWADWSLGAMPAGSYDEQQKSAVLYVKMERHANALAVYASSAEEGNQDWRLVREIQWVFIKERDECWVGVYTARPDAKGEAGRDHLNVQFSGFEIGNEH